MHPEIIKFWEDSGFTVIIDVLENTCSAAGVWLDLWRFYWVLIDADGRQIKFVGASDNVPPGTKDAPCVTHFLNEKSLSEKEMLKVVRMKAFL